MSTIVVAKKNSKVVIGADSLTTQGSINIQAKYFTNKSKLVKLGNSYIGTVGSTAIGLMLSSLYKRYKSLFNLSSAEAIYETLLKIHPILKEEYFIETEDEHEDQEFQSNQIFGLIANKTGAYSIQSYREVGSVERFWAIGSGKSFALGAMHAMYESEKNPRRIAEAGLKAACEFDDGSDLPLEVKTISL